jgi:hypothetical protein
MVMYRPQMAKPQDPRVPYEVEEYLVGRNVIAGQIAAPGRTGARGAERGARRIHTTVEERSGDLRLSDEQVGERVMNSSPDADQLPAEGLLRWAVPLGVTGLQHIVIDIANDLATGQIVLRAYGKEGLISRHPTQRMADEIWSALQQ